MDKMILIVDDELGIRELLRECLEDEGYVVKLAENALEADKTVKEQRFDLILMDVWLPDMDGVSLFKRFLSNGITTPVIMMSGHASITSALEAIRIGARDFLEKPLSLSKLLPLVDKHILKERLIISMIHYLSSAVNEDQTRIYNVILITSKLENDRFHS